MRISEPINQHILGTNAGHAHLFAVLTDYNSILDHLLNKFNKKNQIKQNKIFLKHTSSKDSKQGTKFKITKDRYFNASYFKHKFLPNNDLICIF